MLGSAQRTVVYSEWQALFFSLLRIAIGWHFLREGLVKLFNPNWTAAGYLLGSTGPFAPFFQWMGMNYIDFANTAMPIALTIAGAGLLLGLFTRFSAVIAMGCLAMFYLAAPPFEYVQHAEFAPLKSSVDHALWAGNHAMNTEGNYFLVNKNLIELLALAALCTIPPSIMYGLDAIVSPYLSSLFGFRTRYETA